MYSRATRTGLIIVLIVAQVVAADAAWEIVAPYEVLIDAEDGIFGAGNGEADEDFFREVYVDSARKADLDGTAEFDDTWTLDIEKPEGGWTNSVIPVNGSIELYHSSQFGNVFKHAVGVSFVAGGQQA